MAGRRRTAIWAACAALLVLVGCGGEDASEAGGAAVPEALAYMPADATAIALVPTDLDSRQAERLERLIAPSLAGRTLRDAAAEHVGGRGHQQRRAVDGRRLVDRRPAIALPLALPPSSGSISRSKSTFPPAAIDRRRDGGGASADAAEAALGDDATADALLRSFGTGSALLQLPDLQAASEDPWIRALRGYGLAIELEDDAIEARARVRTDPAGLTAGDLPLETGTEAPAVGREDGVVNAGNRNQSRTTVFLARLARRAYPDSRFVRAVEAIERDLGIRFEQEVLAQFSGPSASLAAPGGAFAAVSDLADPDRMRELLPRLAPRLPAVLRGLQGLGNGGLVALLLFAPDAPLVPGALDALSAAIKVFPLGGGDAKEQLFKIEGLAEPGPDGRGFAGPGTIVFGMIGDRFAVASDERRAREAAGMETDEPDGAEGAAVAWADLSTFDREALSGALGLDTAPPGPLAASLEASAEGLEGRLRVEVPGGLGD